MDKEIHKKIKKIRKEKRYSQTVMANKLGITQMAYSKIERGVTKLNWDYMHQLSTILEVNIWDLIDTQKEYQPSTSNELKAVENIELLKKLITQYDKELSALKEEINSLKKDK